MKYTTQYVEAVMKKLEKANATISRVKEVAKELDKDRLCQDWAEALNNALKGE